jgi:hypothetical protein
LDLLECMDLMQSEQKVCPQTKSSGARLWSLKYSRHTAQLRKSSDIVYYGSMEDYRGFGSDMDWGLGKFMGSFRFGAKVLEIYFLVKIIRFVGLV